MMKINWVFDKNRLFARNESGQLLNSWIVEEVFGHLLAMLMNQNQELSRLVLQLPGEENRGGG